jgi:hypothetical protein
MIFGRYIEGHSSQPAAPAQTALPAQSAAVAAGCATRGPANLK